ncbi:MAG: flagellar motor switch protein FliG, partial [Opitutaceae bacterium]
MADIDYAKLSRQQKLAIFLIVVGPVAAAEVLKELDDATTESLCREMATFPVVPETVQQLAIEEFGELLVVSASATLGGLPYAQQAVGLAKGDFKASAIMGRVGPAGAMVESEVIKGLREMEGRQIYNLIRSEQPQTIAFLLSYLGTDKSTEVFALLTPEL